jgi:hypothetical protein
VLKVDNHGKPVKSYQRDPKNGRTVKDAHGKPIPLRRKKPQQSDGDETVYSEDS